MRAAMLYIVGLGLGDARDITVKGLEIVRKAERVYLEGYTSLLTVGKAVLEEFYGRSVIVADRELVEQNASQILDGAATSDVAFLVVGDPFGATTHTDLVLRAANAGIPYEIVHNASIMNAVGCCGLQLYSFGETVSIPFWTDDWQPDSFCDKICNNMSRGLHTLCLLDIKVKEPTLESLMKKKAEYLPPRFMSVTEAACQLLQVISKKEGDSVLTPQSLCVGLARVGSPSQRILACRLEDMTREDLGPPLHCLVLCGHLHPVEKEYLVQFATDKELL